MRSGRLRQLVSIQERTLVDSPSGSGGVVEEWTEREKAYAEIRATGNSEGLQLQPGGR